MATRFATGKYALGECDVCGFQYKLNQLKSLMVDHQPTNTLACPECWTPEHPQNDLGKYPVVDPQALRNPRPDKGLVASRVIQWGWSPVGISNELTPNDLLAVGYLGTVTVTTS